MSDNCLKPLFVLHHFMAAGYPLISAVGYMINQCVFPGYQVLIHWLIFAMDMINN